MIEVYLKPTEPYKNPIMVSFIHRQIKTLEDHAQYFYEHGLYRLEDLCDAIRYFYLDLISRHCIKCRSRETHFDPIEKGLCPACYRAKRDTEWRKENDY